MHTSQIVSGNVVQGGHRVIIVGLNCRDNHSSTALALAQALGISVTDFDRWVETGAVGEFIKFPVPRPQGGEVEIIGLILRRDPQLPVRLDDLQAAIQYLVRYLGSRQDLQTRDVAMVAIGTGAARVEGGFATLLRLLQEAGYPGVVYEPLDPAAALPEVQLRALGLDGGRNDPLPSWHCLSEGWTAANEREAQGVRPYLTQPTWTTGPGPTR